MSESAPVSGEPGGGPVWEPGAGGAAGPGERSVVVHGPNHAPITTGDHSPINVTTIGPLAPIARVPPAPGPVGVPGHIPLFVGREDVLAGLASALRAGPGLAVQVVHGLGGIGKSALAARYALAHAGEHTQAVWINAEDPAGIEVGLARFALALEPQLGTMLSTEALAQRATGWLAAHSGWLLVLDNVASAGDLSPLLAAVSTGSGRFLVTSRTALGWNRIGAAAVRLGVLEPREALKLLAATIGTTPHALHGGAQLCAELGFLPLAIVQAGAYIVQNQGGSEPDVRGYQRLLAEYPAELYASGDEATDSDRTIARVWRVTLDRLADTPLSGRVLRVLAWYGPDAIPLDLLGTLAAEPALGQAVGRLAAYNMITRSPRDPTDSGGGPGLAVHRLVQAVTRTPDPTDPHRTRGAIDQARDLAAALLYAAAPRDSSRDPGAWPAYQRLMPHIDAYCAHAAPETDTPDTSHVLNEAGLFLQGQGSVARAIEHLDRAYGGYRRVLGEDHPATLIACGNLAIVYRMVGDLGRAIPLLEQALWGAPKILDTGPPIGLCLD
ncbi:tetratricopeptide repeat protein [Actinospica durhamensis]|uniref:Tetratricopeptide repeat protein n=1 Tax=Actinospica durhamensis TaxID=1508375 RepID=A0A941IVJ8_9ACTN|nr:tetratricopeptide repeat protein [Actinospica durhamensis]MBR7839503.1 tetratricopeptide repeat protein [Actinospica durhamensis]